MRTSEAVCDYKPEKYLPAQHTFGMRKLIAWDVVDALAWYKTFTELCNEIKVDIGGGIEIQYHQGNDDMYESSRNKFFQELPKLLDQYERKFVAFINDEIFVSDDEESLVLEVINKYGNIPFYFDKVTFDDEDNIEIISGKLVVSK